MTLKEMKMKVLALIEELNPDNPFLTEDPDIAAKINDVINQITVYQILDSLGEKERKLIELRYLQGKTQVESADILGMNQVAVSRLEKRVLLQLRNQF